MKKQLFFAFSILALLMTFISLGDAGTNVKVKSSAQLHNYNTIATWTKGTSTGYKSNNNDTLFFWKDSASATPAAYYTSELRSKGALFSNNVSKLPDSLRFCIVSNNDSANIDTGFTGLQYSFDGTHYVDIGAAIKIIYAANNFYQLNCYSRPFVPLARFRLFYYNHTATDTSFVQNLAAWAQ